MSVNLPDTGTDEAAAIAEIFVAARRSATPLAGYPGVVPASLDAGYAIQDAAIALDGGDVVGWKVGRIWPPLATQFGSDRLAGPIFANNVVAADGDAPAAMPVFTGGFGAVEAEFIYKLGVVDPMKTSYSLDEAAACVSSVHVGIEIASSPLSVINDLGPAVTVSDFGNNLGLIIGPAIEGWRSANADRWPISVSIDDVPIGTGIAADFPDGTLGSVRFLLQLLALRGIAVPPGTLVSTGAITGVHPIAAGQYATARFADHHALNCTIKSATPEAA